MFCKSEEVETVTKDQILRDKVYQTPVDAWQTRFQTWAVIVLLGLAAVWALAELID